MDIITVRPSDPFAYLEVGDVITLDDGRSYMLLYHDAWKAELCRYTKLDALLSYLILRYSEWREKRKKVGDDFEGK